MLRLPLPDTVMRRTVRERLLLARIEQQRMADMGLEKRWQALGDAVDAWLYPGSGTRPADRSRRRRTLAGGLRHPAGVGPVHHSLSMRQPHSISLRANSWR